MRRRKNIHCSNDTKGITLIELLISIAVLAIVTAFAVPSITSMTQQSRVKGIINNLSQDVQMARSNAISTNSNTFLSVTSGVNWCFGVDSTAVCTCTITNTASPAYCDVRRTTSNEFPGLTMVAADTDVVNVTFQNSGVTTNNGTIAFSSGAVQAELTINVVGGISMCSNQITSMPACP